MSRSTSTWPGLAQAINRMIKSGAWASLSDAGRAVWLPLAKRANRGGRCWPSVATVTKEAGVSNAKVYRGIRELVGCGLVDRDSSDGGNPENTTRYTLMIPLSPATPLSPMTDLPLSPVQKTPVTSDRQNPNETPSKTPKRRKRRDEVFEALAEVCGLALDALTKSARGQLNKATKELREVEAEPFEIRQRAAAYAERYKGATMTPTALCKHWPQLTSDGTTDGGLTTGWVEPTDEELAAVLGEGGDA